MLNYVASQIAADSGPDPPPNRQIRVTVTPVLLPHSRYGPHVVCVHRE